MRKKTVKYTDDFGEMEGDWERIKDDLPTPAELAGKAKAKQKVTLELDNVALDFFKREAARKKTSYQRMIRNLLLWYARRGAG
ncbi:hypothetical protein BH20VER3_BH20VER3_00600 [soil metagenome]